MKIKNTAIASAVVLLASISFLPMAHAADDGSWSFKSINLNAFTWTSSTLDKVNRGPFGQKADFRYLEIEGGLGGKWGDLYGFYNLENPTNKSTEADSLKSQRHAFKIVSNFNIGQVGSLPVTLHAQIYDFSDGDFHNQNRVLGLGTRIQSGGFWMKPFVGVHQESKTGVGAHYNGLMSGWVAGYDFDLWGQKLSLSNWHEIETGRRARYLSMARDGEVVTAGATGINGALSLSWKVSQAVTLSGSYRYAKNKLGSATFQDGYILGVKYGF